MKNFFISKEEAKVSKQKQNFYDLYTKVIGQGEIDLLPLYAAEPCIEHSVGVHDGLEGFKNFFIPFFEVFPKRNIQVTRILEDGNFVFAHAYQVLNDGAAEWMTMDIVYTNADEKIIEHWDTIAPSFTGKNKAGHTAFDGATELADFAKTADNKMLINNLYEQVYTNEKWQQLADFYSTEFIDHSEYGFLTSQELIDYYESSTTNYTLEKVYKIIGEGNFVAVFTKVMIDNKEVANIELYRIQDGKIVEYWRNMEYVVEEKLWLNSGKFATITTEF